MNKKIKKTLLTAGSFATVLAPLVSLVACGKVIDPLKDNKTTNPDNTAFEGTDGKNITIGDLVKNEETKENTPVQTNLLNAVKELSASTLYKEEQKGSFTVQKELFEYAQLESKSKQWDIAKTILVRQGKTSTATAKDFTSANMTKMQTDIDEANKLKMSNGSDDTSTDSVNDKTKIENIKKDEIDKVEAKITKLTTIITSKNFDYSSNKAFYDSSTLASDYPKVLQSLDKVREIQTKSYNDAKDAYISSAATKEEGQVAWEQQRLSKYNNAKDDAEAIQQGTSAAIKTAAFGRYTFAIDSSFTVQQVKSGKFSQFKTNTTSHDYDFSGSQGYYAKLKNGSLTDASDDSKVYFLGTKTNILDNLIVDVSNTSTGAAKDALDLFSKNHIIDVQHALLSVAPATTGNTLPWIASTAASASGGTAVTLRDIVKELVSFSGGYKVSDLWGNVFQPTGLALPTGQTAPAGQTPAELKTLQDNLFLKYSSNNEEATKEKSGDLGINPLAYWVKNMDSGFGLGIVSALSQGATPIANATEVGYATTGDSIQNSIIDALWKVPVIQTLVTSWGSTNPTDTVKNEALSQVISNMSDTEFNNAFGEIFRTNFAGTTSDQTQLVYAVDATANVYMVISSFGIHTIKITSLDHVSDIQNLLAADFTDIAKQDDVSKSKHDWASVFQQVYTDDQIVKELLKNADVIADNKFDDYETDATNKAKFEEWVKAGYIKSGQKITDVVNKTIENIENNSSITTGVAAVEGKVDYLVQKIDSNFLNSAIKPEEIYNAALKEVGVK